MRPKFPYITSPLVIGNTVYKSRMVGSVALPHYLMGPESFPGEQVIQHVVNIAKNGAAAVVFNDWSYQGQRQVGNIDGRHFPMFDLSDDSVLNYLSQLADQVHYYNTKISVLPSFFGPAGRYITDQAATTAEEALRKAGPEPMYRLRLMSGDMGPWKQISEAEMEEYTDEVAERIHFYKLLGFDMCTFHMAYCMTFLGQFLSPLTNHRTDQYGGSLENRARLPLMLFRKIKERCGRDFLVEVEISGEEPEGGLTTGDIIEFGRLADGLVDIFQVRDKEMDTSQPVPFNSEPGEYRTIQYAEKMKAASIPQMIEVVGGYHNVKDAEKFLAEGKCDLIALGRSFICEPEYGKKVREGREEDIVPCIRCNRCHGLNLTGPWITVCSVNPAIGVAHKLDKLNPVPDRKKKVAVIGGGPAGMKAALVAADRGHDVTLFEKEPVLGGQLFHSEFSSFKWTIREYKNWLIAQIGKRPNIQVRLNTLAEPDLIEAEDYEVVLAATGAAPVLPPIPGAETCGALLPIAVYGHEEDLGQTVVVVGGSETGTETALHLAELGREVTLLSRQTELAMGATPTHYRSELLARVYRTPTLKVYTGVKTTAVEPNKVTYASGDKTFELEADTIVLCGGVRPLREEALAFSGCGTEFHFVGDCRTPGNIQTCTRSAYAAASQI